MLRAVSVVANGGYLVRPYLLDQIVDENGKVIVNASDVKINEKLTKTEKAAQVGTDIAKKAIAKKIKNVVLDRGPFKYHGRVKSLVEAARTAKLTI